MAKKTSPLRARSLKAAANRTASPFSRTFRIQNELGLHARAAAQFVKIAGRFRSEVKVQKDSRVVNGKSIMGILMLAAPQGSQIRVTTQGDDGNEALSELGILIENKFGEK